MLRCDRESQKLLTSRQLLTQTVCLTFNQGVTGSNRVRPTKAKGLIGKTGKLDRNCLCHTKRCDVTLPAHTLYGIISHMNDVQIRIKELQEKAGPWWR